LKVPFFSPEPQHTLIKKDILTAIEKIIDANWYVLGESLRNFEKEYAAFNGVNHCIGVGNGLDALQIALKALGVKKGDEVIVPAHTFIASWLAVTSLGAIPRPVEPDPRTYNLDPIRIEGAITPKTKAIMPVHLYGQACEMDAIMTIAQNHNLFVVEDNAQAQGAAYNGKITGSFGHINATSYYPTKNLGALGDAGAITTDDENLAAKARAFRNYGSPKKYLYEVSGQNSRLDEMQAAILRIKLPFLAQWNQQRTMMADCYLKNLKGVGDIVLPVQAGKASHVYHLFVIRTLHRDALVKYLAKRGVETALHYPIPPHLQKAYRHLGYEKGSFPITENIATTSLSLPVHPGLTEEQVLHVCEAINAYFNG
jgi:dTDP-4-amino-4,6-dideoxygalactose transaminase